MKPVNINIMDLLNKFGNDTVNRIVDKIISEGAVDTGRLRDSIQYTIDEVNGNLTIFFSMVEYGKFLDEGTIYIEPREFFNKVIEEAFNEFENQLIDELEIQIEKILEPK